MGLGSHTITAVYQGDGICVASTSAPITVTVLDAPTAVPTVGEWTMWGLAGLLLICGGAVASRRFKVAGGI